MLQTPHERERTVVCENASSCKSGFTNRGGKLGGVKQPRYWPFFCEENVWHLCSDRDAIDSPVERRQVLFVSNALKQVAMRHQRAGEGGAVVWDYHVVLLAGDRLWDLDTTLGFGISPGLWLAESFVRGSHEPRFRVIDAPAYVASFASDRSHMIGA